MNIKITIFLCLVSFLVQAQTFNIPFSEHRIIEWVNCEFVQSPREYQTSIGIRNLLNDQIELRYRTIESHIPTDWDYTCTGLTGTISNCYTDLDQTDFIGGGQRIFFDHNIEFLSAPESTDSLTAKVEIFDVNDPSFKDTVDLRIVMIVPNPIPIQMDLDTRNHQEESLFFSNTNISSFGFRGEVLNPYINKEMYWEEIYSYTPTDWEIDCDARIRGNNISFDMCQNKNGSFYLNCLDQFDLEFKIDISKIGNKRDSLIRRFVIYDPDNRAATEIEFGFTIIKCLRISQADLIDYSGPNSFCDGELISLSVDPNLEAILWQVDGQIVSGSPSITIPVGNLITVSSEDFFGCRVLDTLELEVQSPFDEQICVVTTDSVSGNNLVVWEKTDGEGTEYFKVYRESIIIGEYDSIGMVPFNEISSFLDSNADPRVTSYQYKISTVDNCGNESELSDAHKTLHLTSSQGVNGEVNLIWDNYKGIPFSTVNILTGSTLDSMQLLTQRPSNSFTYTDLTPLFDPVFYQIEIILNDACTARRSTDYFSVRSNAVSYGVSSVRNTFFDSKVEVFPNPSSDFFFVKNEFEKALQFSITDLSGKTIFTNFARAKSTEKVHIDLPKGIYLFIGKTDEGSFAKKLIIN